MVEQLIRPTGLIDPPMEVRPTLGQIDDLIEEIERCARAEDKILVTTITKRMAEELSKYFDRIGIRNRYIHSDVDTLERIQILEDLRAGMFDVLIGVNLLREGLDLPEVALVAILDADKEGFLRNVRSLTQIAGRAARHPEGRVILYADQITDSMRATIEQSNRRPRDGDGRRRPGQYVAAAPTEGARTPDRQRPAARWRRRPKRSTSSSPPSSATRCMNS